MIMNSNIWVNPEKRRKMTKIDFSLAALAGPKNGPKMAQNDPKWPQKTWKFKILLKNIKNIILHDYELKHMSQSREKKKNDQNRFF